MLKHKSALWLMMGIIGVFSIGYYVLPVFFKKQARLDSVDNALLIEVVFMGVIFFGSLIFGVILGIKKFHHKKNFSLHLNYIDKIFIRNYKLIFFLNLFIWLSYYFTADLTSYSADDFEAFFHKRSVFAGLVAAISSISLGIMAVCIAISVRNNEKIKFLFVIIYIGVILMLLVTAQRLSLITPIFMLVAAFSIYDNHRMSMKIILGGVVFLALMSPSMVFLREFQGEVGKEKIFEASKDYSTKDLISESTTSILERADLLLVSIKLKEYYDFRNNNFDHFQYVSSVMLSFVPKIFYKDKPYPLSDDGTINGEISVQAWRIIIGNSTGSLSAFGSISAYREGGWIWVFFNGFLTGVLFVWVYFYLAKGGHVAKFLFVSVFVTLSIKNVPTSLFYFIYYITTTLQIILLLYLINVFIGSFKIKKTII